MGLLIDFKEIHKTGQGDKRITANFPTVHRELGQFFKDDIPKNSNPIYEYFLYTYVIANSPKKNILLYAIFHSILILYYIPLYVEEKGKLWRITIRINLLFFTHIPLFKVFSRTQLLALKLVSLPQSVETILSLAWLKGEWNWEWVFYAPLGPSRWSL